MKTANCPKCNYKMQWVKQLAIYYCTNCTMKIIMKHLLKFGSGAAKGVQSSGMGSQIFKNVAQAIPFPTGFPIPPVGPAETDAHGNVVQPTPAEFTRCDLCGNPRPFCTCAITQP